MLRYAPEWLRRWRRAGRIDVLVNNAGVAVHGSVEELPLSEFRRVMETNFFGALRCIQAVVPGMRERRHGCIVNVTSVAGRFSAAPQAPYSSSKWALEAASEALAQEVKPFGVRVAIVEPGVIATPIFGKITAAREKFALSAGAPPERAVRRLAQESGVALCSRRSHSPHRGERQLATALPRRTRCGALPRLARRHERRRLGQLGVRAPTQSGRRP